MNLEKSPILLNTVEAQLEHYSIEANAQELLELCRPLTELNISTFSHIRSFHNNQFNVLCNNSKFLANYFKKEYYNADPCVQIKAESSPIGQFLVWDVIKTHGQTAAMLQDSADFDFKHVFTIIKNKPDCTEFYHFGTHLTTPAINQLYINNIDLLDQFIHYFKRAVSQSKVLSKSYLQGFSPNKSSDSSLLLNQLDSKKQAAFLKAISTPENTLTKREVEYAQLIIKGMTAKEIALQLKQSPRTIEHRIDGLKVKLQARNKIDLSIKLRDLLAH